MKKRNEHNKRKKRLMAMFLRIVGSIVGVFLVFFGALVVILANSGSVYEEKPIGDVIAMKGEDAGTGLNFVAKSLSVPIHTNFLIMGTDETELLTDVIIAGSFNAKTMDINLISIPRDTYTVLSQDEVQELRNEGRSVPSSGVMKMNAVHSYAGKEKGAAYLKDQVEELLGIQIHYYAEVNLDAFKQIVTAVGGVEMDIPAGGLYYDDPYQNLHIAVPAGRQLLTGEMAEGVVRFRDSYARADLQRIEVQQEFMKEFFKQVLTKETIMNNFLEIAQTLLSYVKTDLGASDLLKYVGFVTELSGDKLYAQTLPGDAQFVNGASYFMQDREATKLLVDEIFYGSKVVEAAAEEEIDELLSTEEVKDLKIQILNGTNTNGLAAKYKGILTKAGYDVVNISDYSGTRKQDTRIMTAKSVSDDEFASYFANTVVEIDKDIEGYDIIIILGQGEK